MVIFEAGSAGDPALGHQNVTHKRDSRIPALLRIEVFFFRSQPGWTNFQAGDFETLVRTPLAQSTGTGRSDSLPANESATD